MYYDSLHLQRSDYDADLHRLDLNLLLTAFPTLEGHTSFISFSTACQTDVDRLDQVMVNHDFEVGAHLYDLPYDTGANEANNMVWPMVIYVQNPSSEGTKDGFG